MVAADERERRSKNRGKIPFGRSEYGHIKRATITKIVNGHPNSQIEDLLPWAYPASPALKRVAR